MRKHQPVDSISVFVPCEMWTTNKERTLHHQARAKLVKPVREAAETLMRNIMNRANVATFTVPVHVEFYPFQAKRGGRLADTANHLPPCKAALDGIVDAGLLHDDTPEWVLSQRFWPPERHDLTGVAVIITAGEEPVP